MNSEGNDEVDDCADVASSKARLGEKDYADTRKSDGAGSSELLYEVEFVSGSTEIGKQETHIELKRKGKENHHADLRRN